MAHPEIQELMNKMPEAFVASEAEGLDAVLQFKLSGEKNGDFYAVIKDGKCETHEGMHDSPTTTFSADGQDWLDVTAGKADGTSLFMQGRLAVDGDMSLAMRMQSMFKNE